MLFAADVLERNPGRRDHFRREIDAQPLLVDTRARRQADDVEDGPLVHQEEAEGDRRAARGRDERPHLLQGALVRLRRRDVRGRAAARDPLARSADVERGARGAAGRGEHARAAGEDRRRRELHADRQAQADRELRGRARSSSRSTGCASSTRTASASRGRRTRRRSSCCASKPTTSRRSSASRKISAARCSP